MLGRYIDYGEPVADHPLTSRLAVWLLPLPGNAGGQKLHDLKKRVTLDFVGTTSWASSPMRGGDSRSVLVPGSGNGHLFTVAQPNLSISGGTVSCWLCPLDSGTFGRAIDANFGTGFWIGRNGGSNFIGGALRSNSVSPFGAYAATTLGVWSHITLARTGAVTTCYKDGVAVDTFTSSDGTDAVVGNLAIGMNRTTNNFGDVMSLKIDDIAIWNRTLTAREVGQWYEQSRKGHPETLRRYSRRKYLFTGSAIAPTITVNYTTTTAVDKWSAINTPWHFETNCGASNSEVVNEPLEFSTTVELSAYLGGSMTAGPGTGPFEFETVTAVSQQYLASPPTLLSFTTVTAVSQAIDTGAPLRFTTTTGVRVRDRMLTDGRIDLIDTRRYRR